MVGVYNFRVWNSRDGRYWIPPLTSDSRFH
jgi:hypothetical protein